jgi:hypothetical protein
MLQSLAASYMSAGVDGVGILGLCWRLAVVRARLHCLEYLTRNTCSLDLFNEKFTSLPFYCFGFLDIGCLLELGPCWIASEAARRLDGLLQTLSRGEDVQKRKTWSI